MSSSAVERINARELIDRYAVLLVDAYGVLMTHDGLLPHAQEFISYLREKKHPFFIVTNDASRSEARSAERYRGLGLPIAVEQVITSGSLLGRYFAASELRGSRCVVLGPPDSAEYVRNAGGVVVDVTTAEDADALVICDERGFDLLTGLDRVLSLLCRKLDAGEPMHLVVPNPDVIYPQGDGRFGFTAGGLAAIFESALEQRYPVREDLHFVRLGKPHRAIYDEARRRAQTDDLVMIGDQLATDIRGAVRAGIDSALVTSGLTRLTADGEPEGGFPTDARPTYLLESLACG